MDNLAAAQLAASIARLQGQIFAINALMAAALAQLDGPTRRALVASYEHDAAMCRNSLLHSQVPDQTIHSFDQEVDAMRLLFDELAGDTNRPA